MKLWKRRNALTLSLALFATVPSISGSALAAGFDPAPLEKTVQDAESRLSARIGVAVLDSETGKTFTHRADERFPLNSTFKAFLCAALLEKGEQGEVQPDRRVKIRKEDLVSYSPVTEKKVGSGGMTYLELCDAAITISDNAAANLVLEAVGGPQGLTDYLRGIGDTITRLDRTEPALNEGQAGDSRDTTTPAAAVATLQKLVLGDALSPSARDQLTGWLLDNQVGKATLRAGLPEEWPVADKTGAGGNGSRNNIGVIWPDDRQPVVIAVYITQTDASFDDRNKAIADIGAALAESLRD
ncbi:Beta-lactamase class A [Stappia aggregata IAM 12614]|uniref:Beta-lactamase n=1 Tax=Roseibium aggregatum (strain ATCC 25650 / DSM 13394 / JCM 20685 / NBRC 16684 / NCIMB 2208 / IAM 12614 / B1) TaxID=384765 RepID=A0NLL2_ROSAI|nr:class A beta-lactamase [Roseibium aggregatum]EAV45957.1 Beta-lactamase class A [Stappia aggregata IAM 12614] [Roseibium aggregatum IAM 12614]